MSDLNGIEKHCSGNIGGLITVEYIPDVDVFPDWDFQIDSEGYLIGSVPLLKGWLKAPFLPKKKLWDEDEKRTKNGKYYDISLSGIVPKLRPSVSHELDKMSCYRYFLRVTDRNNQKWLIGHPKYPLEFTHRKTTADVGKLNNYLLNFKSKSIYPAVGLR